MRRAGDVPAVARRRGAIARVTHPASVVGEGRFRSRRAGHTGQWRKLLLTFLAAYPQRLTDQVNHANEPDLTTVAKLP